LRVTYPSHALLGSEIRSSATKKALGETANSLTDAGSSSLSDLTEDGHSTRKESTELEFLLKDVTEADVSTELPDFGVDAAVNLELEVLELSVVVLDELVDETTNNGGGSRSERNQGLPLEVLSGDTSLAEFLFHLFAEAKLGKRLVVDTAIDVKLKVLHPSSQLLASGAKETTDKTTEGLTNTRCGGLGDLTDER